MILREKVGQSCVTETDAPISGCENIKSNFCRLSSFLIVGLGRDNEMISFLVTMTYTTVFYFYILRFICVGPLKFRQL